MSVQITVVLPSVSTAGSLRIRAFLFDILCTPRASEMVTTAGSASGTTATGERDAEYQHFDKRLSSEKTENYYQHHYDKSSAGQYMSDPVKIGLQWGFSGFNSLDQPAIFPNSLFMPVSTTTARRVRM